MQIPAMGDEESARSPGFILQKMDGAIFSPELRRAHGPWLAKDEQNRSRRDGPPRALWLPPSRAQCGKRRPRGPRRAGGRGSGLFRCSYLGTGRSFGIFAFAIHLKTSFADHREDATQSAESNMLFLRHAVHSGPKRDLAQATSQVSGSRIMRTFLPSLNEREL